MKQYSRLIARAALVALLAVVVPACGNKNESAAPPAPPAPTGGGAGGPTTLLSEDFSGTFPGTHWSNPSGTTGTKWEISATVGNPAPSLSMTTEVGPGFIQTQCDTPIMSIPFTVSVDMAVLADGEGSGALDILDSTANPVAAVEWHPTTVGGAITFMIADPAAPGNPKIAGVVPPATGPTFHTFVFSVDSSGNASWTMDGGAAVLTQTPFSTVSPFSVRLYDNIQAAVGPFATFYFDNVKITSP